MFSPSRIASRFLGGSVKRKERPQPKPCLGSSVRGALSWLVEVHDHSFNQRINCVLGLSAESRKFSNKVLILLLIKRIILFHFKI